MTTLFAAAPARIEINVDGLPIPKGSKSAFVVKGRAVVTDVPHKGANRNSAAVWRESIAASVRIWLGRNGRPEPLDGPLRLELHFRLPRPTSAPKRVTLPSKKPDADKLCRFAADVLSGLLYVDDARIVDLIVTKRFAIGEPPGVRIAVEPVL